MYKIEFLCHIRRIILSLVEWKVIKVNDVRQRIKNIKYIKTYKKKNIK